MVCINIYIYIYICVIYILYIAAICMTFLYYLPHSDLLFVYVWRWTLLQIASTWHFCWVELLCEPGQRPATSPGIRDRSFRRATPSASWGDWLCTGARSEQKPWIYHEYPINIYIYIYIIVPKHPVEVDRFNVLSCFFLDRRPGVTLKI